MKNLIWFALMLSTIPLTGNAAERPLTAKSEFIEFVRTDPRTGEPLLIRNGKLVSVDARLNELMRLTHNILRRINPTDGNSMSNAEKNGAALTSIMDTQNAGIPEGVFVGKKFAKNIADPKLKKVMELEWYLGQGLNMKFRGLGMNSWLNCGFAWYVNNTEGDRVIASTISRVSSGPEGSKLLAELKGPPKPVLKIVTPLRESKVIGKVATIARRGAIPAAIIAGTAYFLSTRTAEPTEAVGNGNSAGPQNFEDNSFGAE